jgi:serine/threonine-protein kinase
VPITSTARLVDALRDGRVLDPAQLTEVTDVLQSRYPDSRALARELMQRGWLTAYQVNQLLQGRGGELVLGEYLLLERLGEGGMGQVFKARHQLMNRIVALKVIRKDCLAGPDALRRFQREIQLAAQLNHPHLVRAEYAAQVGDTHFLVMEYAEGTDLHRLVQKAGPLPVEQACAYVRQAALGLQHAHERGLVHRDIKPSNLQVTARGTVVKILDMGLARAQTSPGEERGGAALTQTRTILGTADYIAPEQIRDPRQVDIRADIYSLGCTFYFLLAGRPPFPDGAWEEKLVCHSKVDPQPLTQVRPDVPPALAALVGKMMAKRPEERYLTPADVASALAPFCSPPGGAQTPPGAIPVAAPRPTPVPGSMDQPAGPERGWTLMASSTVVPPPVPAPPAAPPRVPGQSIPGVRKRLALVLAGAGAVLGLVILLLIILWPKGGDADKKSKDQRAEAAKNTSNGGKPDQPTLLIDENFRKIVETGRALPDGWTGNAVSVVTDKARRPCLEANENSGEYFVTLPLTLSGSFFVEGEYALFGSEEGKGINQALTILLEPRKGGARVPVVITWDGYVTIAANQRRRAPNYENPRRALNKGKKGTKDNKDEANQFDRFRLVRSGKGLSVFINNEVAAAAQVDEVAECDTVRIGLTAGEWYRGSGCRARLYSLKVGTLPQ